MPRPATPRGLLGSLLVLCLSASVLGSAPLQRWAEGLPDASGVAQLQAVTRDWNMLMDQLRLAEYYAQLRGKARAFEAERFGFAHDSGQ
jgi:hypothetical protein